MVKQNKIKKSTVYIAMDSTYTVSFLAVSGSDFFLLMA